MTALRPRPRGCGDDPHKDETRQKRDRKTTAEANGGSYLFSRPQRSPQRPSGARDHAGALRSQHHFRGRGHPVFSCEDALCHTPRTQCGGHKCVQHDDPFQRACAPRTG